MSGKMKTNLNGSKFGAIVPIRFFSGLKSAVVKILNDES